MPTIVITDTSSRADILVAITELRAKRDRMPRAWVDKREAISDEVGELVAQWLEADA